MNKGNKSALTVLVFAAVVFAAVAVWVLSMAAGVALSATDAVGATEVTPDFLAYLVTSFNGLQGAGVLGTSAILVQVILRALDQPFANKFFSKRSGVEKLAIVAGLTFALTPMGLMTGAGLPLGAALLHTSTLTAFTVLLHQLYEQSRKARIAVAEKTVVEVVTDKPEGKAS